MDREAWHAIVHGVAKSWTRLTDTCICMYSQFKVFKIFNYHATNNFC